MSEEARPVGGREDRPAGAAGEQPFARELIRHALDSIADQMCLTVVRTAHSDIVKSAMDFSTALCDGRGRLIAQGLTLPNQLGSIPDAIGAALGAYRDRLAPGDVLVAETTSPPWTPLFASVAAVVTDTGGALSHCAVVAREYGIPAVVGVGRATTAIADGQLIEVDGDAGVVRVVQEG